MNVSLWKGLPCFVGDSVDSVYAFCRPSVKQSTARRGKETAVQRHCCNEKRCQQTRSGIEAADAGHKQGWFGESQHHCGSGADERSRTAQFGQWRLTATLQYKVT